MADWLTWEGTTPGLGGGALTADVVRQITASADVDVTNHPIESGSTISDHVIRRPKRVTFEFAQSTLPHRQDEADWTQEPLEVIQSRFRPTGLLAITMLAGKALAAVGGALGIGGQQKVWLLSAKDSSTDRIKELHDTLVDVLENSYTCTFNYRGLVLPGYVLTSVQYSRGVPGGIARFTIEAQEVRTVATSAAALATGGAGLGASVPAVNLVPLAPKGPQATKQVEQDVVERSGLATLQDAVRGR